ncbi:hypothetical protein C7M84_024269 [Penaeus vannamei]|uniref:Uncharacterized protein n=1 Tax=Penaeus vannamei TaxID=6689 RepID=A0A3R7NBG4_PENVA|nr:hypothetical protein C7M84_024269 [Penaeus vannamei]
MASIKSRLHGLSAQFSCTEISLGCQRAKRKVIRHLSLVLKMNAMLAKDLLSLVCEVCEDKNLRVSLRYALGGTFVTALTTFAGFLVMGPVGFIAVAHYFKTFFVNKSEAPVRDVNERYPVLWLVLETSPQFCC